MCIERQEIVDHEIIVNMELCEAREYNDVKAAVERLKDLGFIIKDWEFDGENSWISVYVSWENIHVMENLVRTEGLV